MISSSYRRSRDADPDPGSREANFWARQAAEYDENARRYRRFRWVLVLIFCVLGAVAVASVIEGDRGDALSLFVGAGATLWIFNAYTELLIHSLAGATCCRKLKLDAERTETRGSRQWARST